MDAQQIRRLGPALDAFLAEFHHCFGRSDTRSHLPTYVRGLLSDLPRKSVEPLALAAHVPPRTLQQFLALLDWDHPGLRRHLHTIVARDHAGDDSIGLIDDTGCPKKGTKTPGVQRQYCGASGKIDNCVVTVHLGYATGEFHCLLDSDLYLPQSWADDRPRCRQAGIPDEVLYRPKWQIALDLLDRATANGVRLAWLTFDEDYGGKPAFLRGLQRRGQLYVAEVPSSFSGWLRPPRLRGRGLQPERPAHSVAQWLQLSPRLREQPWVAYRIKEGHKGPVVWEAKRVRLSPQDRGRRPGAAGAPGGGPQRAGAGQGQVLRQQRAGGHAGRVAAVGGVPPLAGGTLLRGRENGTGARSLRGPQLHRAVAAPVADGDGPCSSSTVSSRF